MSMFKNFLQVVFISLIVILYLFTLVLYVLSELKGQ